VPRGEELDSTPLYEEGPWGQVVAFVHRPVRAVVAVVGGERCSPLYRLLVRGQGRWEFAPVAHLLEGRQAARGSVAGSGLSELADRVHALDGQLTIESEPGCGTCLRAEVPYAPSGAER